jgi:hypothetical protein
LQPFDAGECDHGKEQRPMTQIITCLTQDYVAMAADRLLMDLHTGKLVNDEAQKLIVLGSQLALAYTGLANVKPAPRGETDLWVVNKLSPPPDSVEGIIRTVQDAATERFRLIAHLGPQKKRHAFVFAGWRPDAADRLEPFVAWSSNSLDDRGRCEVRARPTFEAHGYLLQEQAVHVMAFGQPWTRETRAWLRDSLTGQGSVTAAKAISLVAAAVRRTARTNRAVGRGLQAVVLPRDSAGLGAIQIQPANGDETGSDDVVIPPLSGPTAIYLRPDSNRGEVFAPHHIDPGMTRIAPTVYPHALSAEEGKRLYEEWMKRLKDAE